MKRIVNTPKRSIGDTSVAYVDRFVEENGISFLDGLRQADQNEVQDQHCRNQDHRVEHALCDDADGPHVPLPRV